MMRNWLTESEKNKKENARISRWCDDEKEKSDSYITKNFQSPPAITPTRPIKK